MKNKLTIDEQITDLKEKGVVFNIMDKEAAKNFFAIIITILS